MVEGVIRSTTHIETLLIMTLFSNYCFYII